jgi:phage baseplate assembly protein W
METKELDTLFLGRGWSFPTTFVKTKREVTMVSGEDDIKQSLEILLGTTLGERIMHPDFGCNLKDYLFQPMSTTLKSIVQDLVKTAIVKHEARIDLLSINLNTEQELEGVLLLEINYTVRATNSRSNYVYPFYLEEGTNT